MTRGALIFAFNNQTTDYVTMAAWTAARVRQHLGIPVAVVTDVPDHAKINEFDHTITSVAIDGGARYLDDYGSLTSWYNVGRIDSYDLSPWDQTLVLDADYVVDSDRLKDMMDTGYDFLCFRSAYDIARNTADAGDLLPVFGRHGFPMWWATVMLFKRTSTVKHIFDVMKMVKQNYQHYKDIYGIGRMPYRNDYALSIALNLVNGHTLDIPRLPWRLPSVMPGDTLDYCDDKWIVYFTDAKQKQQKVVFSGMDFHAMGKNHLEKIIANQI